MSQTHEGPAGRIGRYTGPTAATPDWNRDHNPRPAKKSDSQQPGQQRGRHRATRVDRATRREIEQALTVVGAPSTPRPLRAARALRAWLTHLASALAIGRSRLTAWAWAQRHELAWLAVAAVLTCALTALAVFTIGTSRP